MDEEQVKAELEAIEKDLLEEVAKLPQEDETFKALKHPGDRQGVTWPVATIAYVTYAELQKRFGDPWVWGASVLGDKYKGRLITEYAFVGPEGREWKLAAVWDTKKGVIKEGKIDWILGGTGTDYDLFMTWLAKRLDRPIPVIPSDPDCTPPRVQGIAEVFGLKPDEAVQP